MISLDLNIEIKPQISPVSTATATSALAAMQPFPVLAHSVFIVDLHSPSGSFVIFKLSSLTFL